MNLASSEYNKRREECELGVKIIKRKYQNVSSLRDVTLAILETVKLELGEIIYKRCFYVVSESIRVKKAVEKLKNNDLNAFGKLMYESHEGLQHFYNVSCPELDFLVDFSKDRKHVLGSRMMGGGFGGCTISIIHEDAIKEFKSKVSKAYKDTFKVNLTPIVVSPSQGAHFIMN